MTKNSTLILLFITPMFDTEQLNALRLNGEFLFFFTTYGE